MFHLPAVPFAEIEQCLIGLAVIGATSISIYQFFQYKLHAGKHRIKSRRQKARRPNPDRRRPRSGRQSPPQT
jgi:hypothetical protein